jgi:hypothetical protein
MANVVGSGGKKTFAGINAGQIGGKADTVMLVEGSRPGRDRVSEQVTTGV